MKSICIHSHQEQCTGCTFEHFLLSWNVRSVFFSLSPTSPSRTHSATLKHIATISQMDSGFDFEHPGLAAGFIRFSCRISVVTSPCVSWSTKVNGLRQDKGAGNQLYD